MPNFCEDEAGFERYHADPEEPCTDRCDDEPQRDSDDDYDPRDDEDPGFGPQI